MDDLRIAKIVRKLQDLPGQELFQYVDEEGQFRDITSQDVNSYLGEITGEDFTAKDFRTWAGTVLVALALNLQEAFQTKKQAKANVKDAISAVSKILGNTPAVCRKCYVHPAVLESYLDGDLLEGLKIKTKQGIEEKSDDLEENEMAVLQFLRTRLEKKAA
jgi:DNA topoisomerase-1